MTGRARHSRRHSKRHGPRPVRVRGAAARSAPTQVPRTAASVAAYGARGAEEKQNVRCGREGADAVEPARALGDRHLAPQVGKLYARASRALSC